MVTLIINEENPLTSQFHHLDAILCFLALDYLPLFEASLFAEQDDQEMPAVVRPEHWESTDGVNAEHVTIP